MKQLLVSTFLFAGLLSSALAQAVTVDEAAPDFTLTNMAGEEVSLSDYAGKYVILEWTNHLCPYVQKHYDSSRMNMQNLQSNYTEQDVVWLSIISSAPGKQGHVSPEKARELTEERGAAPTHVLFDPSGDVGRAYDAKTTPHMYLIDPEGTLRYAGAIDSIKSADPDDIDRAENYVNTGMTALYAGEAVDPRKTVPYGCSVKY